VGCMYPHHNEAPYAEMVNNDAFDPLHFSFLQRSEYFRENSYLGGLVKEPEVLSRDLKSCLHLKQIMEGLACIACQFCHASWTLCENSQYYPHTANSQEQFPLLCQITPRFVEYFFTIHTETDWIQERTRFLRLVSERKQKGFEKRNLKNKKAAADSEAVKQTEEKLINTAASSDSESDSISSSDSKTSSDSDSRTDSSSSSSSSVSESPITSNSGPRRSITKTPRIPCPNGCGHWCIQRNMNRHVAHNCSNNPNRTCKEKRTPESFMAELESNKRRKN
jgi:hypothetical protein